ncbi:hypothetical protein QFC24_002282 [Naganishia onofrii]|uniref:Uncharacterized protein n=1 Tax=Naganishia onofrii TaxID=1851511 RepID=A0ACC2XPL9_9TREE|nr:hypothetical protein QFC24_002282 [Naganishia onofrii]
MGASSTPQSTQGSSVSGTDPSEIKAPHKRPRHDSAMELPVDSAASTEQGEPVRTEEGNPLDGMTIDMAAMTLDTDSQAENTVPVRKLCLRPLAHSQGSTLTLSSPHLCCLAQVELSVVLRPATFSFAPGIQGSSHQQLVNENGSAYLPPSYQSDMSGFDASLTQPLGQNDDMHPAPDFLEALFFEGKQVGTVSAEVVAWGQFAGYEVRYRVTALTQHEEPTHHQFDVTYLPHDLVQAGDERLTGGLRLSDKLPVDLKFLSYDENREKKSVCGEEVLAALKASFSDILIHPGSSSLVANDSPYSFGLNKALAKLYV